MVNDEVDASEVVGSPDYIINIDRSVGNADGVCLEDAPRLLFRKAAAFYVVGVIGQVYLSSVVDAAFDSRFSVRVKHSGAGKSSFGHSFWMATVPLSEYSMSFRLNMLRAVYPERNNYVLSVLQFRGTRHILLLR